MTPARLLIDPPLAGPLNMARDEALLRACPSADPRPVLRLYAWSPPTISLGYFQQHAEYQQLPPPAGDLPVVRRTTGGGAILHDLEITYALILPLSHPLVARHPNRLYQLAHQAVIKAIGHDTRMLADQPQSPIVNRQSSIVNRPSARRGPFFCFDRRHDLDVVVDDPHQSDRTAKIAGSAQRRTPNAILQHGSIMLDTRYPQQTVATWTNLENTPIDFDHAAQRLLPALQSSLAMTFTPDTWQEHELQAAAQLQHRYAGQPWTIHRLRQ